MTNDPEPSTLRFRIAFFLVATLIVGMVVVIPFAIRSLFDDLYNSVKGDVHPFGDLTGPPSGGARDRIHASVVELDESHLNATLRVSGHRVCSAACSPGSRVVLFSVGTDEAATAGMPPSGQIDLVTTQQVVTGTVTLPIHGHPSLYPFDTYELWLGVGLADIAADQTARPLTRQEATGLLTMTIQEQLPRESMAPPEHLSPSFAADPDDPYELLGLAVLRFSRPLHEQVLAVLLVLLVAAAAAYAVFMRPLHDLVLNSGALVLGVWGIRSILSPGTASRTLVDLSLSTVILFLLGALTIRALEFCYDRGRFRGRPSRWDGDATAASTDKEPARRE